MSNSAEQLQQTPLYQNHLDLGAKMVPFGGWEMPVQYAGILDEHKHTREKVSIFDTCHMGEFVFTGDAVEIGLDRLVSMKVVDMKPQTCRYGMLLNEQGTVIDDLILFRQSKFQWVMIVNGATTKSDEEHILSHVKNNSHFQDISKMMGKIDVQGPKSRDVLNELFLDLERLSYYHFDEFDWLGERVLVSRTGYTGELGFEIYCPVEMTQDVWNKLLSHDDIKPAGLGARDVLRLEVGYPLYGHELSDQVTPLEAGLKSFVDFEKDFIGKSALEEQLKNGVPRKLVGIKSPTRRAPRPGQLIYTKDQKHIGEVVSGTFSPMLNTGIALAYVNADQVKTDDPIFFGNDKSKSKSEAVVSSKIFYRDGSLKK